MGVFLRGLHVQILIITEVLVSIRNWNLDLDVLHSQSPSALLFYNVILISISVHKSLEKDSRLSKKTHLTLQTQGYCVPVAASEQSETLHILGQ